MEGSAGVNANATSGNSMTRWSTLGRRSVRNLTALLKRSSNGASGGSGSGTAKQAQQQLHQPPQRNNRLFVLDNNCVAGWNCVERTDLNCDGIKQFNLLQQPQQQQQREPSRIRTTVLGCPKRLRASMPAAARKQTLPPPPPPPPQTAMNSQNEPPAAPAVAPSPLFEVRRQHRTSSRPHSSVCHQSDSGGTECPSLLLELDGQQRRFKYMGRRLSSPSDVWALFASQWPAAVQSLGSQWRIQLQRSDWPSTCWQTLTSDDSLIPQLRRLPTESRLRMESTAATNASVAAGCSCECTCGVDDSGGSHQRIERLEAQVISIARQLDSRRHRLTHLRDECRQLRTARDALRLEHDSRTRETRRMFVNLSNDVHRILAGWTTGMETVNFNSEERDLVEAELQSYRQEGEEVSALLDDVDATTSELRHDVLKRRCRTSSAEVELLALHLSRATQRLASLKNRFPQLESRTRDLLRRQADVVASDERQLADEQQRLETWLRRVKKLTMMLYTFKQLAEAQAKEAEVAGPPPTLALTEYQATAEDAKEVRRNLLLNIASVCPDHGRRLAEITRAEAAIQRRQRMIREAAALKAEKTLTAAASRLKPVTVAVPNPVRPTCSADE